MTKDTNLEAATREMMSDHQAAYDWAVRGIRPEQEAASMTKATWREQVEAGLADHRARGLEPKCAPQSEADWNALQAEFPKSLYAGWYAITGRRIVR